MLVACLIERLCENPFLHAPIRYGIILNIKLVGNNLMSCDELGEVLNAEHTYVMHEMSTLAPVHVMSGVPANVATEERFLIWWA